MGTHTAKSRLSSAMADPALRQQEHEARRAADAVTRDASPAARTTAVPAQSRQVDEDPPEQGGRPLPQGQRASFESQFGRDFSQVRVHADEQAARRTERASARAITRGAHILFGAGQFRPGTRQGRQLIAHELAHVAQQQDGGAGAVATQCDPIPGKEKQGPGNIKPAEPFVIGKGVAGEDNFVLFEQDSADLSASAEKKLLEIAGNSATPVTVEVHGYASIEGASDYNTNLSAHRAIAVKKLLLSRLPPGSQVTVYARGETQAFGADADNRRVGVKTLQGAPAADASKADAPVQKAEGWTFDPIDPRKTGVKPSLTGPGLTLGRPSLLQSPSLLPPLTPPLTLDPNLTLPPLSPPSLLDWSEMRAPFTARGLRLSDRDARSIEQNWWTTYTFLRGMGLRPDLAAWGANKGTAYAYDNMLSRESPNTADLFDQEWEKTRSILAPGQKDFRTPIVPILTPTTLEWMSKTLFNKDWKFTF